MPDLLLEFFSEEIPARMQARAAEDLKRLVTDRLVAAGLTYDGAKAFATPRRLALAVAGIPARQPDIKDERKGPKVGAPEQAIAGFLRAAGLTSIDQAKVQPDKKGDFYVAVIDKPGRHKSVSDELLQILRRPRLHPRGNFLGEEFEKEIGHQAGANFLWLPSHSGGVVVRLQVQNQTSPVVSGLNSRGENDMPLCEPSHSGCDLERPQAHHQ